MKLLNANECGWELLKTELKAQVEPGNTANCRAEPIKLCVARSGVDERAITGRGDGVLSSLLILQVPHESPRFHCPSVFFFAP